AADMEGKSVSELLADGRDREKTSRIDLEVRSGHLVHETTQRTHRSGVAIDVEVYGVPLVVDGVIIGQFWLYQDISARVKAQAALLESEELFRTVSSLAPVGIVLLEEQGKPTYVNEQYLEMTGMTREEAIASGWRSVVHPEDLQRVAERRNAAIAN